MGPHRRGTQPVEAGKEQQIVLQSHLAVEARLVKHNAHARPYVVRVPHDIVPGHARRPRRRREQGGDHLHRGRLAGPVRAEQGHHLTGRDAQRHAFHGHERAEAPA